MLLDRFLLDQLIVPVCLYEILLIVCTPHTSSEYVDVSSSRHMDQHEGLSIVCVFFFFFYPSFARSDMA